MASQYDHMIDALSGWNHRYALMKTAELDPAVDPTTVKAGMVMSLNASGKLTHGIGIQNIGIFVLQNGTDLDVNPLAQTTPFNSVSSAGRDFNKPGPRLSGFVATGGYELQTTEFDSTGVYSPNMALTAHETGDVAGKLLPGEFYRDNVCGVVSEGVVAHHEFPTINVLRFWPCFLPANPANAQLYF